MTNTTDTARYEAAGNLLLLVETLLDHLTPAETLLWLNSRSEQIALGRWAWLLAEAPYALKV